MSKSITNLNAFIADLDRFGRVAVPFGVLAFQKLLVKEIHRLVLTKTPIDKGVLRGNWILTINDVDDDYYANKKTEATLTGASLTAEEEADVQKIIEELDILGLGQTVHLTNSTPYALQAERDGWSAKSPPYAMVELSLQEIRTSLAAAKKEFELTVSLLQENVGINYATNL